MTKLERLRKELDDLCRAGLLRAERMTELGLQAERTLWDYIMARGFLLQEADGKGLTIE